jgi:uncharacterized repeat protein (TIGR01451 family)
MFKRTCLTAGCWRAGARRALHVPLSVSLIAMMLWLALAAVSQAAGPSPIQFFYLPLPEGQVMTTYKVITTNSGTAMTSVTSIALTAKNTVIYYDQWEDGYELDVTNKAQASTEVWGDGNTGNGNVCPLVKPASLCSGDVMQPGAVIILRNDVPQPRNPANLFYDGRDKVSATKIVTVARSIWYANSNPGTMLADASEAYDLSRWGTDYRLPIGEDLNAMSTYMYEYVSALVMAAENGTSVTIDKTGNGASGDDVTVSLNQGDAYQVSSATVGDLTSNAHITSNKPIQVHLTTGDIGSSYEQRWYTLLPTDQAGSSYWTPVCTVSSSYPAAVFIYNPSQSSAITVSYQTQSGSGTFNVAAKGVYRFAMPTNSGAHFYTTNAAPFMAVGAMDTTTNSGATTQNQTYDWGYTLVPENSLTTKFATGWAPGTGDVTPAADGSPVWVMSTRATTIYVDYDGDPATGANTAPNGAKYDVSYNLAALESKRIYDSADKDQTGLRVFTADGALLAGVWGEDPTTASAGSPFLDVGYTIPPLPEVVVQKSMRIYTDVNGNGLVEPGDTLEYTVSAKNLGVVTLLHVIVTDNLPQHATYVLSSTAVNGTPKPDNTTPATVYPLDEGGLDIGNINLGATSYVTFRVTADPGVYEAIINTAEVATDYETYIVNITTPVNPVKTNCTINFTDSAWANVSIYLENGTVYVQVTDNDRNTNTAAVDTINAIVQDATTGDSEGVTLTETGVSTGIFRGSLPSSVLNGQAAGDGILYARGGEQITATATDPIYGDVCTAQATITVPSNTKYLYLSDPSQALDRADPVAATDTSTATSPLLSTDSGAVAVDATSSTSKTSSTGSVTLSHTTGTGSNRLLLVGVSFQKNGVTDRQVSTVTYSGQSLTRAGFGQNAADAEDRAEIWYLMNPPSGTANVVVTMTGASNPESIVVGATTFTGVHQTTPLGTAVGTGVPDGSGAGSPSVTVASATGQLVFDTVAVDQGATLSENSGQTQRWDVSTGTGTEDTRGAASTKAGAASVTMAWTSGDTSQAWAIVAVPIRPAPAGVTNTSFTQSPVMASNFVMPGGGSINVTTYVNVTSGSMPASPNITAVLKYGATSIATLSSPTYNSGAGTLTWTGALASGVTVPAGQALALEITTNQSGVGFQIRYDSSTYPSRVSLPTTTVINLTGLQVYDAPYPGGNPVSSPYPGQTVYVRVSATDPFGAADITSVALTLSGTPVTLGDTYVVASTMDGKTYEYAWTTPSTAAPCPVNATVKEGFETGGAAISASNSLALLCQFQDTGTPSITEFTTGNNGAGTGTYPTNQQVCVRVTDADQNLNSSAVETVTAVITSSSGDSETITLTETGVNTGVFTNCIPASSSGGSGNNSGTLNAPAGSNLTVTYIDPNDPSDTSNDTAVVSSPTPAMAISKTRIQPTDGVAVIGETVRFDVVVSNPGPTTLNTVAVTDNFPSACVSFQSASITPSVSGATLTWSNIGPIASGGSKTINLYFTVTQPCNPATNTAQASGTDTNNQNVTAGPVTAQVITTKPSVTVTKTLLSPVSGTAVVSGTVTYRIDVVNNGSTSIPTLPLTDQYSSACLAYVSSSPSASGGGGGVVLWNNVGPLAVSGSNSVTVSFHVEGPCNPATNVAMVNSAVDQYGDPVPPASGSATVVTTADPPQVTVAKTLVNPAGGVAYIGDAIQYQVEIKNTGTSDITSLTVTDTYDSACQAFVSASVTPTGTPAGQVVWNTLIPSEPPLLAGTTRVLTLNFTASGAKASCLDTVSISGKDEFDQTFGPLTANASVQIPLRLSGTVFDDANGSRVQNLGEPGTNAGGLYVNLLDSANKVVAWAAVDPDGTYDFPAVPPNATYTLQLTTNRGTIGQTAPAIALPANWVTTGENANDTPDSTPDSKLTVAVATTDVTGQNFGIEQLPSSDDKTAASQLNPGGTVKVQVPALTGSDPEDGPLGTGSTLKITSLPTNGTLYYNSSPVTLNQVISNYDPTKLTVDPNDGSLTVTFTYAMRDAAGQFDPTPATVTMPFGTLGLSGHVFDDANGSQVQNGAEVGTNAGGPLYVNLLDSTGTTVIATTTVNANGTYSFPNVSPNTSHVLQLTTSQGVAGNPKPGFALPANWVTTGENASGTPDGTPDSYLFVSVVTSNVIEQNFGIEQLPDSVDKSAPAQKNPGGTNQVPAPALSGSDPEDGTLGTGSSFKITGPVTNGALYYNGSPVTTGQVITNYDPTKLTVDPADGAVTVTFPYASVDAAGKVDPTAATVTMPFTVINLSGVVFDDANGNQLQNPGPEPGTNAGGPLYVNLLDSTGTTVIATTTVNPSGSYSFANVSPNTTYVLQLTANQGVVGNPAPAIALPGDWLTTGENASNVPDGTPDSKLTVAVATTSVTSRNFGIEEPPTSDDKTAAPQLNPGGTVKVQVPALTGSDPEDGPLGTGSTFKITSLPTNGALYYNGSPVTLNQVITGYDPTKLTVDPNDGSLTVTFTYAMRDAAGQFDPSPATVTMPFTQIGLSGTVFDDANGSQVQNGAEVGTNAGGPLYVNLLDASSKVVATTTVNANGTYSFPNVGPNTTYTLQLTANQGTVGQDAPAFALPANWVTTGENSNGTPDGSPDSKLTVAVATTDVIEQNFGIERLPDSDNKSAAAQPNPEGTNQVQVPALTGSDPEDGPLGTGSTLKITGPATNGVLYYNGSPVTTGQVITNYDPTKLTVDPADGAVTVTFPYAMRDAAGQYDPSPATVTMPFTQIGLSGTVFDDANASQVQNGAEAGTNTGSLGALWVNLLDANNKVLAVAIVNNDGKYSFPNVAPNTTYTLLMSKNPGTVGQDAPAFALPANWVTTGENANGTPDGTPDSTLIAAVATTDVTGQNFGIEQLPNSDDKAAASQSNPGGTNQVQVPALTGSDPEDGPLGTGSTLKITSLPTNGTLYYNGSPVTLNQVITNYDPTRLTVDPVDGNVTMVFTYAMRDAAGQFDPTPATVTMPFTETPQLTLTKSVVGTPENRGNGVFRVTYQIVVQNSGDVELRNVEVTDRLDQTFTGAVDFTVVSTAATQPLHVNSAFTGKSPHYDLLTGTDTLAVGASATITIVVDVTPGTKIGPYTNLADSVAETPVGVPVRTSSNPATVTFDVVSAIGVAKQWVAPVVSNGDGTYDVTYLLTVVNLGDTTLSNVQVYDNLNSTFGAGMYTVRNLSASGLTVNPTYTGAPPANLLTGTNTLAAGATGTITLVVRVTPGSNLGPYSNQARATASGPNGALPADTLSNNGTDPDTDDDRNPNEPVDDVPTPVTFPPPAPAIGAAKALVSATNNHDGSFTVIYDITVKNYGDTVLNNVQVTDNLATTFAGATIVSASAASSQFTVNALYNGTSDVNVLAGGNTLALGATKTVTLTVKVRPVVVPATFANQGTASGISPAETPVSDVSTVGTDPDNDGGNPGNDNDGNPGNNGDPTPVTVTFTPGIALTKSGPAVSYVGGQVAYTYTVKNTGDVELHNVTPADDRCSPLVYQSGDNGDGKLQVTETWTYTCTYTIKSTDPDPVVNHASVQALDPLNRQVTAAANWSVDLVVMGFGDRVWLDVNSDGVQDPTETTGLYNVPITVTGLDVNNNPVNLLVYTDLSGMYSVQNLAPGTYTASVPSYFSGYGVSTVSSRTFTLTTAAPQRADIDFGYALPTGVALVDFVSTVDGQTVRLEWQMALPDGAATPLFTVWRAAPGGAWKRLTPTAIGPISTQGELASYLFKDMTVEAGHTYRYRLDADDGSSFGPWTVMVAGTGQKIYLPFIRR